jgi:hypothetical protein
MWEVPDLPARQIGRYQHLINFWIVGLIIVPVLRMLLTLMEHHLNLLVIMVLNVLAVQVSVDIAVLDEILLFQTMCKRCIMGTQAVVVGTAPKPI